MEFLLKTPVEDTVMSALGEITMVDIFYSKKNKDYGYQGGQERMDNVIRAAEYDNIVRKDVKVSMNVLFNIQCNIPVLVSKNYEKEGRRDANHEVIEFVSNEERKNVMSSSVTSRFMEFKKHYKVLRKSNVYVFIESDEDEYNYSMTMLWMKEILMGNFLYTGFDVSVSKKTVKGKKEELSQNVIIHNNLGQENPFRYTHKGVEYTTPARGVYTPDLRAQSFGEFGKLPSGRMFQKMQYKMLFEAGENNYYLASGGSGKSAFLLGMAKNYILGERHTPRELSDGKLALYYGLSHAGNVASINKTKRMVNSLFETEGRIDDRKGIFRVTSKDNTTYLNSFRGETLNGQVQFLSGKSEDPGRGTRPTLVIVDEFLKQDDNNREIVGRRGGDLLTQKFYISTMNNDSGTNSYYLDMINAEREYSMVKRSMHDIVHETRRELGLHECNTLEEFKAKIPQIIEARTKIMMERPNVGIRFDIRDVEHQSDEGKQHKIKTQLGKYGPQYVMHEYFSIMPSEVTEFPTKGLIIEEMPRTYDYIIYSVDLARSYDKPALARLGVLGDCIYVLGCDDLPVDDIEQKRYILSKKRDDEILFNSRKSKIYLVIDASGNGRNEMRDARVNRGLSPDYCIYTTSSLDTDPKFDADGFLMVGKIPMVRIAQDYFKSKRVRISNVCTGKNSLIEQFMYFKRAGRGMKAEKGKDDKVMATLMGILVCHICGVKIKSAAIDAKEIKRAGISYIDKLDLQEQENKAKEERQRKEEYLNMLMYANW